MEEENILPLITILNEENILTKIIDYIDIKDVINLSIVNKTLYQKIYKIYKEKIQITIKNAKECVLLCEKYMLNENYDVLSTICYEIIDNHSLFIMLNWKNFSTNLINHIDQILKNKNNKKNINLFQNELEEHRNKLIYICRHSVDLYKYNIKTLINITNCKGLQNKSKYEIVNKLKKIK